MTVDQLIQTVIEGQSVSGAFLSVVNIGGRAEADWNGFTTALTLRALAAAPDSQALRDARGKALDFLELCESPDRPGAFGFWPGPHRPAWGVGMVEDADDTAVIALELFRHGRRSLQEIRRIVCKVLLRCRVSGPRNPSQPWVRDGAFLTWLRPGLRQNPVDCCVNANVAALMAVAGLTRLPGYLDACEMIQDGVRWAGRSWAQAQTLSPYYPDPADLEVFLAHAVESGAAACEPALRLLREFPSPGKSGVAPTEKKIFASSDGNVFWVSPVLATARQLSHLTRRSLPPRRAKSAGVEGPCGSVI